MTIGILIFSEPNHEKYTNVDRLEEAAQQQGHKTVRIYEPFLSFHNRQILHSGKPLPDLDVIISRPNFIEEPSLRTYAVQLLLEAGYKIVNSNPSFAWTKNKLTQHVVFDQQDLPCPNWGIARKPSQALELACKIGFPIIMKVAFGTHGKGVFYAENHETFQPIAEYLAIRDGNPLIIEEYIEEAQRKDLRVFVLGGKVIAAMEREAAVGDIRANTSTGGTGHVVELTPKEIAIAEKTAQTFNLDIAGVDLIQSKRGILVLEVNSNPGFKELERMTGIDIAGNIIGYATSI